MKLASELSALSGIVKGSMTGCSHKAEESSRSGAGDETTRRDVAGDGQADHMVSSRGDSRHQLPADAAVEDTIRAGV